MPEKTFLDSLLICMRYLVINDLVHMNFFKIRQKRNRDSMSNFRNQKSLDFYIVSSSYNIFWNLRLNVAVPFNPMLIYFTKTSLYHSPRGGMRGKSFSSLKPRFIGDFFKKFASLGCGTGILTRILFGRKQYLASSEICIHSSGQFSFGEAVCARNLQRPSLSPQFNPPLAEKGADLNVKDPFHWH